MKIETKTITVFVVLVAIALVAGFYMKGMGTASVIPNQCSHSYPCTPQLSGYTPSISSGLPLFSTVPVDSYNVGDTVTKSLTVENSSTQIDSDYSDGTVNYVYAKWVIFKDDAVYQSGTWVDLNSPTYTHQFSLVASSPGKYAFVVVLVSASSTFDETANKWSDYTVSKVGTEQYAFTVNAPNPPVPSNALADFFNNLLQSLLDVFKGLFGQ